MRKNNMLLIIPVILLLMNSCCKDIPCPSITKEEKEWIPYNEGDTLIFKDYSNDSIIKLYVASYDEDELYTREQMKSCYNSCVSRVKATLLPVSGYKIRNIHLTLEKKDSTINLISGNNTTYNSFGEENTNEKGFLFDLRSAEYIDSLKIGNQIIYDVYKYNTSDIVKEKDIETMYIKKGWGIIMISFNNGLDFQSTNLNQ